MVETKKDMNMPYMERGIIVLAITMNIPALPKCAKVPAKKAQTPDGISSLGTSSKRYRFLLPGGGDVMMDVPVVSAPLDIMGFDCGMIIEAIVDGGDGFWRWFGKLYRSGMRQPWQGKRSLCLLGKHKKEFRMMATVAMVLAIETDRRAAIKHSVSWRRSTSDDGQS